MSVGRYLLIVFGFLSVLIPDTRTEASNAPPGRSEPGKSDPPVFFAPGGPPLNLTKELTVEAWVLLKPNSHGGSIVDKTGPQPDLLGGGFSLEMPSSNTLQFRTSKKELCRAHFQARPGEWVCITAVYSAEKRRFQLFLNGKVAASISQGDFPGLIPNFSPLLIGNGRKGKFEGQIARVAIFAQALNAEEIAARFSHSLPSKKAIAEWKITERHGQNTVETVAGSVPLSNTPPPSFLSKGLAPPPTEPLTLWYRKPAENWGEALPLGNGRLAAMVFGRLDQERIALNESSFWSGAPHDYTNPDALPALRQARSFIFKKQYAKADRLIAEAMQGTPATQCSYQPLGDLIFDLPTPRNITGYRRQLNLSQGIASVLYSQGDNSYLREAFISATHQIGVIRWTAHAPGSISFSLHFESPQWTTSEVENSETLVVHGRMPPSESQIPNKLQFVVRIKVLPTEGTLKAEGNKIEVSGANSVTVLWDAATNYRNYQDITADPDAITRDRISRASGRSFDQLLKMHLAEQTRLFDRVSLQLASSPNVKNQPTDERLKALTQGRTDPDLIALYFQFARYALLASSRPGGQPTPASGIWTEDPSPSANTKYLLYGPTLMTYWAADALNLSECFEPVAPLCSQLSETHTAALMYGTKGWTSFASTDIWRGSAPSDGTAYYTPVCGAALASLLWKHYLYTDDQQYLKATYPILKNATQFFLESLQRLPHSQEKATCPTVVPGGPSSQGPLSTAGSTFDTSVLRELFTATANAARVLGDNAELQPLATLRQLPPLRINALGSLQMPSNSRNSPCSLYALYPANEITLQETPRLAAAARKSLEQMSNNGGDSPWVTAWKANFRARLGDGDQVEHLLETLLQKSQTAPNFLGSSRSFFQLSGVLGAASAVTEALIQTDANGEITLLPALPTFWSQGSLQGIRAPRGFEINLFWKNGRLTRGVIHSLLGQECKVRYKNKIIQFPTEKGHFYQLDGKLKII